MENEIDLPLNLHKKRIFIFYKNVKIWKTVIYSRTYFIPDVDESNNFHILFLTGVVHLMVWFTNQSVVYIISKYKGNPSWKTRFILHQNYTRRNDFPFSGKTWKLGRLWYPTERILSRLRMIQGVFTKYIFTGVSILVMGLNYQSVVIIISKYNRNPSWKTWFVFH